MVSTKIPRYTKCEGSAEFPVLSIHIKGGDKGEKDGLEVDGGMMQEKE